MTTRKRASKESARPDTAAGDEPMHIYNLRLPRELFRRAKKLAFDREKDIKDFFIEGIEIVLKREKY